ncbi:MAG: NAD(+) kinase, partial [Desulfuromonas sp.]
MKRIGIFAKRHHQDAIGLARDVAQWLAGRQVEVLFDESLAAAMQVD